MQLTIEFNQRRKLLKMSIPAIAQRSGVSTATVNRILRGGLERAEFRHVVAVASALGISLDFKPRDSGVFVAYQARGKAERLVGMVQASSALEKQAVGKNAYRAMVRRTAKELLKGSRKRLWSK
ncbi:MAG TPA: helix-turn-helix domain-containing protein [Pirellulales bacterium]|nr:helix-turn-helix domain-containing protein [Pirellulales bacterium]